MTNILQYSYFKCVRARSGTHWEKWSPAYLIAAATACSMAMPLAVLFIYVGEWGYPGSKMWKNGSWFPNTPHGIILYLLKFVGVACFMVGVMQVTQLHRKISAKWREIRKTNPAPNRIQVESGGRCETPA
mmetsp:Transcript_23349/g.65348  ORF Transcript_23349/g.65348 Transcript_23349/m.65348 type:complete len:130 (-) Transcript_23349:79-468(-)